MRFYIAAPTKPEDEPPYPQGHAPKIRAPATIRLSFDGSNPAMTGEPRPIGLLGVAVA